MSTKALGPFVALYCREILGDVDLASLDDGQFGRLVRYWLVMSEMGGRLPGDPAEIARRSRLDVRKVRHDVSWFPRFFIQDISDGSWRSPRLEKQAVKYAKKTYVARVNGKPGRSKIGEVPAPEIDPYMGVDHHPEMGAIEDPEIGVYGYASQTQTQTQKEKDTTPTPPQAEGEPMGLPKPGRVSRRKRAKAPKPDPFQGYSPEVTETTNGVLNSCPRVDPNDGRSISIDPGKVAERIDGILQDHPKLDGAILLQSWLGYLARKPKHVKAPQYYFGEAQHQANGEGANWFPDVRLLWHLRLKQEAQAPSPPTLPPNDPPAALAS
jgi:hypothetical protein